MKPNSRQSLKEYCLRRLGYPVINIEVSEEQIEDCIDDAIQIFNERYYDGIERAFYKKIIKKEEKTRMGENAEVQSSDGTTYYLQKNYITLPDNVISVTNVVTFGISMISSFMNTNYHMIIDMLYNIRLDGLVSYAMTREYFALVQFLTSGNVVPCRYNRINNKLYIDVNMDNIPEDRFIVVDCYIIPEAELPERYWNDIFLKKYATLLIKRQWGQNLIKYDNFQLVGGGTINGQKIYDEANQEIEKLFEEMSNTWQMPALDRVG